VVCITVPPLRQRRDEIPALTELFLSRYCEHYNKPPMMMATDTLRLFGEHAWPGNVRELENLVKRMVVLGTDEPIRRELAESISARTRTVAPSSGTPAGAPPPPASVNAPVAQVGQEVAALAPSAPLPRGSLKDIARQAAREAERELIFRTLHQTRWNRREAAELLGISYKALLYKIKEAEMDRAS
jgi:two-component system response regulator AtoC